MTSASPHRAGASPPISRPKSRSERRSRRARDHNAGRLLEEQQGLARDRQAEWSTGAPDRTRADTGRPGMDRLRVTDLTEQLTGRDGVEAARRAAPKLSPEQPAPVKAPPSVYALALRALEQYAEHETPGGDPGVSETASSDQESLNDEAYSVH